MERCWPTRCIINGIVGTYPKIRRSIYPSWRGLAITPGHRVDSTAESGRLRCCCSFWHPRPTTINISAESEQEVCVCPARLEKESVDVASAVVCSLLWCSSAASLLLAGREGAPREVWSSLLTCHHRPWYVEGTTTDHTAPLFPHNPQPST